MCEYFPYHFPNHAFDSDHYGQDEQPRKHHPPLQMGQHSEVDPGFTEAGPLLDDSSVHDPPDGDATNLPAGSGGRPSKPQVCVP